MGTRSAIGYATADGRVRGKYSHYDGYPAYTGKMLNEHYQQSRKIAQLVELGDQSFLDREIFPKGSHSFDSPEDGCTIFYGRDRGETGTEPHEFDNIVDFVDYFEQCGCEYFYVYMNGVWMMYNIHTKEPWQDIREIAVVTEVSYHE